LLVLGDAEAGDNPPTFPTTPARSTIPPAVGPEADALWEGLDKIQERLRKSYLQGGEVRAIKALSSRFLLSPQFIQDLGAAVRLIDEDSAPAGEVNVTVYSAYAERMPVRIRGQNVALTNGERICKLHVDWTGWGGVSPSFGLTLDLARRQAVLSDGQILNRFPLRIALPTRSSLVIDLPQQSGAASVRIVNGYTCYGVNFTPDGGAIGRDLGDSSGMLREDASKWNTVVPLLGGRLYSFPPGGDPMEGQNLTDEDKIILNIVKQWLPRLTGARDELQDGILIAMNRLDALNQKVAALPADADPDIRKPMRDESEKLYDILELDMTLLDLFIAETQAEYLNILADEIPLRVRLREIGQQQALNARGAYDAFLGEVHAAANRAGPR
jgi:hypothetical protein